ncbi:MAG: hypothetical protein UZ07_CHB004000409 [Chlorobi bacterium OLB7]|nr:MAG: hypothetical protein UZ07_CHB004000409 [Chlorobi bacterium OLB7]
MTIPETTPTVVAELERMFDAFPDLPREAIIKQDILRVGLAFDENALAVASGYKPKDYFIFSFDLVPLKEMQHHEAYRSPEEIRMTGGAYDLRPTIVSVRVNPDSPYRVQLHEGRLALLCEGTHLADLEFPPIPDYYAHSLSSGKKNFRDSPGNRVGVFGLSHRLSPLPVLGEKRGMPVLRPERKLPPAKSPGPRVHRRQSD